MAEFTDCEGKLNDCIQTINRLNELLKESDAKIEAILNLIDIRIKENEELAVLHYPQPEDKYINQYYSRADELKELKKLIHGE